MGQQQPKGQDETRRSGDSHRLACCWRWLLLFLPGQAVAQEVDSTPTPDVQVLLDRAEEVYDGLASMQAVFEQTIEIPLLGRRRDGSGTVVPEGAGPLQDGLHGPSEGDVIVADGQHPVAVLSEHASRSGHSDGDRCQHVTGAGMVDLQGRHLRGSRHRLRRRTAGHGGCEGARDLAIALTPTGESPYRRVRVWVDEDSFLVRRFEILEENETVRTVILDELRPNDSIADSVFEFVPPEGTDVFEG